MQAHYGAAASVHLSSESQDLLCSSVKTDSNLQLQPKDSLLDQMCDRSIDPSPDSFTAITPQLNISQTEEHVSFNNSHSNNQLLVCENLNTI